MIKIFNDHAAQLKPAQSSSAPLVSPILARGELIRQLRELGIKTHGHQIGVWMALGKISAITGIGYKYPRFRLSTFLAEYEKNLAARPRPRIR